MRKSFKSKISLAMLGMVVISSINYGPVYATDDLNSLFDSSGAVKAEEPKVKPKPSEPKVTPPPAPVQPTPTPTPTPTVIYNQPQVNGKAAPVSEQKLGVRNDASNGLGKRPEIKNPTPPKPEPVVVKPTPAPVVKPTPKPTPKSQPKKATPKKVAPKKVEVKAVVAEKPVEVIETVVEVIEEDIVEVIVEDIVEDAVVEEVVRTVTTSRLDMGDEDSTPYELLSPIEVENSGSRKQYITRSEVADILYTTLNLDINQTAGPYMDVDNTIYMVATNAAIQNNYMYPVDKTEFGAWDKMTWSELSHIARRIKKERRFNGNMGSNITDKNMDIDEMMLMYGQKSTKFPTKSTVVRVIERLVI